MGNHIILFMFDPSIWFCICFFSYSYLLYFIFCLFIIASERDDFLQPISVSLDGKKNSYWSYMMKKFLKGKKIWGYIIGTLCKPMNENDEKYAKRLDIWEISN